MFCQKSTRLSANPCEWACAKTWTMDDGRPYWAQKTRDKAIKAQQKVNRESPRLK
jgi:hypothetical protein